MSITLEKNSYGKSRVRVTKVSRTTDHHELTELSVDIQLEGDFETAHTRGDNSTILPTDTMKNTVYALAKDHPCTSPEQFGLSLANHFLNHNPQVTRATVTLTQHPWTRIGSHPHAFVKSNEEQRTATVTADRRTHEVSGGIAGLTILKTTDSGFSSFIKDNYTTLQETEDRILATEMTATWQYQTVDVNFNESRATIRRTLLGCFAEHQSLSVQHTLYAMGEAVLRSCREITKISITMSNKHHLLVDLARMGLKNPNEIFVPTDEPYGLISATLTREG